MKTENYLSPAYLAIQKKIEKINRIKENYNVTIPERVTAAENINPMNILFISHPAGKMEGVPVISTYAACNRYCQARIVKFKDDPKTACSNCFSATSGTLNFDKVLKPYIYNSNILSSRILNDDEIPQLLCLIFRFESHGDLINVIHAINYLLICLKNPNTKFTIWTKNPGLLKQAIKHIGYKPQNLTVIYSSLRLNEIEKDILKKYDFIDKVFTVFSAAYAIENNIHINCGNKKCKQCQNCYILAENSPVFINEILKDEIANFTNAGGVVHQF